MFRLTLCDATDVWKTLNISSVYIIFYDFIIIIFLIIKLSWIETALYNPDIFCFGDLPCHPVVLDILKSPPDDANREIRTW